MFSWRKQSDDVTARGDGLRVMNRGFAFFESGYAGRIRPYSFAAESLSDSGLSHSDRLRANRQQ